MILTRRKRYQRNQNNYDFSVSDLMSGLIFIFIITIIMILIKLSEVKNIKQQVLTEYKQIERGREELLKRLKLSLEKDGVKVIVDPKNGSLRLPEDLLFKKNSAALTEKGREAILKMSDHLGRLLNCNDNIIENICEGNKLKVHTIFFEGHSDPRKLFGRTKKKFHTNLNLSVQRSMNAYQNMHQKIRDLKNKQGQHLFSVSGYGASRPLERPRDFILLNSDKQEDWYRQDRRLVLRFMMSVPKILAR